MDIKLIGGKELSDALTQLPKRMQSNIMRGAMRSGARVIADEAKRLVPKDTRQLEKSIKVSTSSKGYEVKSRAKTAGKGAWYAHLVEFGTQAHIIKPLTKKQLVFTLPSGKLIRTNIVRHTGAKSKPFMRPALDTKSKEAIMSVGNYIKGRLNDRGLRTPDFGVIEE